LIMAAFPSGQRMIRQQKTSRTRDWLTVKQGLSVN